MWTGTHPELPGDNVDNEGEREEVEDEDGNKDDQANGCCTVKARGGGGFLSE